MLICYWGLGALGWELRGLHCYKFFSIQHSWEKAAELCRRWRALSVRSTLELHPTAPLFPHRLGELLMSGSVVTRFSATDSEVPGSISGTHRLFCEAASLVRRQTRPSNK
uniref:Uncharacterized protein n=1 Tax=Timema monikensis TaxID=170555 RepID=A0A7R9E3W5_9NEOP|nr:unnamed protein product [Timema monikensis]